MPFNRHSVALACFAVLTACAKQESGGDGAGGGQAAQSQPSGGNPIISMQPAAARNDPRAQIFLAKGCPQCHAISKLRVVSQTNVGPDLSTASTDVRQRFNTSLEEFLANPTGTMQIVFSSQIRLTVAERDSITGLLRQLGTSP